MIVGYLVVKIGFIEQIRNLKVIGWTTLVFGILLYLSDKSNFQNKLNSNFTIKFAILIGFYKFYH